MNPIKLEKGKNAIRLRCAYCGREWTFVPAKEWFAKETECPHCKRKVFIGNWLLIGCAFVKTTFVPVKYG